MRLSRVVFALVLTGLWLFGSTAWAGQLVVLESTSDTIGPGDILDSNGHFSLSKDERLVIVDERGQVHRLEGPLQAPLPDLASAPGGSDLVVALAHLVAPAQSGSSVVAASRGQGGPWNQVWSIDITRSGTYCASRTETLMLWRATQYAPERVVIEDEDTGRHYVTEFPSGSDTTPWPSSAEIRDRATYTSRSESVPESRMIVLNVVPNAFPSEAHRIAWMARNGCESQARALLATLY